MPKLSKVDSMLLEPSMYSAYNSFKKEFFCWVYILVDAPFNQSQKIDLHEDFQLALHTAIHDGPSLKVTTP